MLDKFPEEELIMEEDFLKYPKIPYLEEDSRILGSHGYAFEKIDGSLSQVRVIDRQLVGGSKANYITGSRTKAPWFQKFLKWMHSNHSLHGLKDGVIMFGEWLEPITVDYPKERRDKFYFIDLGYVQDNTVSLFDYNEAVGYLRQWGIKDVQFLDQLYYGVLTDEVIKKIRDESNSQVGAEKMEGVVLKDYSSQRLAKSLHPDYSEIRKEVKEIEAARYITPTRVSKIRRYLRNERSIDTPSLEDLVGEIVRDIGNESGKNFQPDSVKSLIRLHLSEYPYLSYGQSEQMH